MQYFNSFIIIYIKTNINKKMKPLKKSLLFFLSLLFAITFISCNKDDNNDYIDASAWATVSVKENKDFFFILDDGKTMFPVKNDIPGYDAKDGSRCYVYFNFKEKTVPGYDYNIWIREIYNILTKNIIDITPEKEDSVGNDKVNIYIDDVSIVGDYINIPFLFPLGPHDAVISLVHNQERPVLDDYVSLELRLNNDSLSYTGKLSKGLVSFKLDKYNPAKSEKKGINLIVNTLDYGEKEYKINLPEN